MSINCRRFSSRVLRWGLYGVILCILLCRYITPIPLCTHAFFDGLSSFFTRRTYDLIKPGHNNYVLALSYMDQFTWAATRLRSLQCWTSRWEGNYQVVEPFLIGTHLGAPVTNNNDAFDLKFSDAANME